jgi:hypothetical protein
MEAVFSVFNSSYGNYFADWNIYNYSFFWLDMKTSVTLFMEAIDVIHLFSQEDDEPYYKPYSFF